ncbi:uncharacterized protein B0H64DRAFT_386890 [Chaetomium fimeti]|uniref:Uncharacterized protein n=1 Tax=Chaetomium fimeti TaxID=1854472 RepID=A0AAE0HM25_9PEZI|nr:hypothetical protein B0H64DRAFT_386890 [Chaetomium fimeti]
MCLCISIWIYLTGRAQSPGEVGPCQAGLEGPKAFSLWVQGLRVRNPSISIEAVTSEDKQPEGRVPDYWTKPVVSTNGGYGAEIDRSSARYLP